jgi:hypothetical protein
MNTVDGKDLVKLTEPCLGCRPVGSHWSVENYVQALSETDLYVTRHTTK